MKFLIVPNTLRQQAIDFACEMSNKIVADGHAVAAFPELITCLQDKGIPVSGCDNADMAVVIGGDGTVLRSARLLPRDMPIWTVNFGHLGYLTDSEPANAIGLLGRIYEGDYNIEQRITLNCRINGRRENLLAFNEAVIYRASISRALKLDLTINGQFIRTIQADGIITATPTGSTAYNLSAGGPILMPQSDKIAVTSICQSIFSLKSMVANGDDIVTVTVHLPSMEGDESGEKPLLVLDGLAKYPLEEGDVITVTQGQRVLKLVETKGADFYQILQMKLAKSM